MEHNKAVVERYVMSERRHAVLLHANVVLRGEEMAAQHGPGLARDAATISDGDLDLLLNDTWRERLTAAWLIGMDRRVRHRPRIGELLLASEVVHAGQGYCFALARFGEQQDSLLLAAYLTKYLALDRYYDQTWAMGALLHLDSRLGTRHAGQFLLNGAWQRWSDKNAPQQTYIGTHHHLITTLCTFADDHTRASG
ncbi:DUF6000 family protein [Actinokineospora globicatena]|uniref:Uncharacterized protein n=1 Tax=Actinokineospora globicatena TaxID=103729 RepID=A0A9W6V898_9PSEU|nr:DUF6000 family protein [Actinokineospora globicatena]GLW89733.1 hypothetical protein Aglo03_05490 [Actinokineospora globicatena]